MVVGLGAYWWVERQRAATSARATTTATQTTPSRSSTSTSGSSATTTSHAASATTTSTAQRSTPATNTGPPTVQVGSTGTVVKTLQTDLNTLTAWGLAVDGVFGPLTLAAVRAFQAARGITVDGIVGPVTWANIASTLVAQKQDPYVGGPSPGVSGRIQWPLLWQQAPSTAPSYVTRRCGYAWVTYKNPTGDGQWVAEYHDATKIRVFLAHGTAAVGTWTGGYDCASSNPGSSPTTPVLYAALPSFVTRRCGTVYVCLGAWPNRPGYVGWQKFTNGVTVDAYPQPGSQSRGTWAGGYVCPPSSSGTGTSSTGSGSTSGGGSGGVPPLKE